MLVNFSWLIQGELAGSGQIGGCGGYSNEDLSKDLQELSERGIEAIVSLTEIGLSSSEIEKRGFSYLHLPIRDMTPPSVSEIKKYVEFIEQAQKKCHPVLTHCVAGLGRTGTMLASYLVKTGLSPVEAMSKVRLNRPGSIETSAQEMALFEYSAHLIKQS